jgi:hypothetical protein
MKLIQLLESKNRCLNKFLEYSKDFFVYAENDDLSNIQKFQDKREKVIKSFSLYDKKIVDVISQLKPEEKTPFLIEQVKALIQIKEEIIQSILTIDQKIIAKIEEEKIRLLQELSSSDKKDQLMKKFKSHWVPESGDKLDGQI